MKPPCEECLTLPICRQRIKVLSHALKCPLVMRYILGAKSNERPMYMNARTNKISKIMGGRKIRNASKKYSLR